MKRRLLPLLLAPCLAHAAAPAREVSIVFVGDVMVAERPGELIAAGTDPLAAFQLLLARHDLRIGNLECVVATGGNALAKPYTFRADPRVLPVLKRHFDATIPATSARPPSPSSWNGSGRRGFRISAAAATSPKRTRR